ncbi:MAG: hypothetical protein MJ155_00200 [Candidatus Saccharibacteria bacterium]|nr:hypothetical protein [Candidatus Saccharibacteria bacterium]
MDQNYGGAAPQNQNPGPQMPPVNAMPNPAMPQQPIQAMPIAPTAGPIAQPGEKKGSIVETIILVIVCLIAAGAIVAAVIFYMKWDELNTDFEIQKNDAVATAQKEQKDLDEANFTEREKLPTQQFTGPSDYGSISFYHPKTWSIYVSSDGTQNSDYEAYFSPGQVDPIDSDTSRYALRFIIKHEQADDVMREYQTKVNDGEMTASVFNAGNGASKVSGTKFEGQIEDEINGIVLVIKVNDKTVLLQTDAETFRADYETLIATLRRNS